MTLSAALDSSSITGESLVLMFLPSIPIAIMANVPAELIVIPALLIVGWIAARPAPGKGCDRLGGEAVQWPHATGSPSP